MRESAGSGIREISDAEGRPPAPTSEGIQAEFYLSFRDAWAVSVLGRRWVCFSGKGSWIAGDQIDFTSLSRSPASPCGDPRVGEETGGQKA